MLSSRLLTASGNSQEFLVVGFDACGVKAHNQPVNGRAASGGEKPRRVTDVARKIILYEGKKGANTVKL